MIFDKKIDSSLWMMVYVDRQNRDEIVDFIQNFPEELRREIIDKLALLKMYKDEDKKNMDFLCGEFETEDKLLYWYEIDSYHNELDMGYKVYNCGKYEDVFEITLAMRDNISIDKYFQKEYIGKIEYDIYTKRVDDMFNIVNSSENDYYLVRTPLGYIITYLYEDVRGIRQNITRVNILDIPEDVNISDLDIKEDENRLVRRRKK